jgi:large subunit ribosomal protein L29
MKLKELNNLSVEALKKKLHDSQLELMKVNVQIAMGTDPKLTGKIKYIKKTIARIMTILNKKEKKEE